ncbi:MAG: hypothetical protein M1336_07835, partial [Deltaproteobacteria bacterium]|nr:hypothetical protein [Deltaproteobacteria bacterium]
GRWLCAGEEMVPRGRDADSVARSGLRLGAPVSPKAGPEALLGRSATAGAAVGTGGKPSPPGARVVPALALGGGSTV